MSAELAKYHHDQYTDVLDAYKIDDLDMIFKGDCAPCLLLIFHGNPKISINVDEIFRKLVESGRLCSVTELALVGAHITLSNNLANDESFTNESITKIVLENCTNEALSFIGKHCPNAEYVKVLCGTLDYQNVMTSFPNANRFWFSTKEVKNIESTPHKFLTKFTNRMWYIRHPITV